MTTSAIQSYLFAPLPAMRLENLVTMFLAGKSEKTITAYNSDLNDLSRFLGVERSAIPAAILSQGNGHANYLALSWRTNMLERKLLPNTVNRRLAALRSLVKLGRTLGMTPWILEAASVASRSYRDVRGPGLDAIRASLALLDALPDAPRVRRDRAILRLLWDSALRRGEIASLNLADLDLARNTVSITGKGKREQEPLTLSPTAAAALKSWLEARGDAPGPLFPSMKKGGAPRGRLSGGGIAFVVGGLGEKVGARYSPHKVRHSAITAALESENGNVSRVRKFSRHADVRTVLVYEDRREDDAGRIAGKVGGMI